MPGSMSRSLSGFRSRPRPPLIRKSGDERFGFLQRGLCPDRTDWSVRVVCLVSFCASVLRPRKVPKASLASAVYDFGTVKKGAKLSQTISLRNTGDAPLIIERMTFSLPALTARVKQVVRPGEEASLALQVDTAALSGDIEGDIVVHTNDPQAPRLSLRVQGRVRSPVEVLPRPAIFLSAFRWEAETKKSVVTVVNRDESPLEILGNRTDGDRFAVELTVVESGQRYQLAVKFLPSAPAGPAGERITLSSDKGEIEIPVFTFLKEKVVANPPDVDLGRLSLEQLDKQPSLLAFRSDTAV